MSRRALVFSIVSLAFVGLALLFQWLRAPDYGWEQRPGPIPGTSADMAKRGEYLVRAGDCIACHTAQGGEPYAGGRGIPTPFGTIYSSNLTPDDETGLGRWNADEFYAALHFGRSRDGRRLYPAFPYTSFTRIARQDADAMYAYLRSLPPVRRATPRAEVRFPYDTQAALAVWRAIYFRPKAFVPDGRKPEAWNRGAYLVEGLGHCTACHTSRTWLGGPKESHAYAGGPIPMIGWEALPLTSSTPIDDAQAADMAQFLKGGASRRAAASGPMAEVVFRSLQYLDDDDIDAMVAYLRTLPYQSPARRTQFVVPEHERIAQMKLGAKVYEDHCADCHGKKGEGEAEKYPALAGNPLVASESSWNAVDLVLFGGFPPSTSAVPRPYGMPPYARRLSHEEIAAVLTYVRASWGNEAAPVSVKAIEHH